MATQRDPLAPRAPCGDPSAPGDSARPPWHVATQRELHRPRPLSATPSASSTNLKRDSATTRAALDLESIATLLVRVDSARPPRCVATQRDPLGRVATQRDSLAPRALSGTPSRREPSARHHLPVGPTVSTTMCRWPIAARRAHPISMTPSRVATQRDPPRREHRAGTPRHLATQRDPLGAWRLSAVPRPRAPSATPSRREHQARPPSRREHSARLHWCVATPRDSIGACRPSATPSRREHSARLPLARGDSARPPSRREHSARLHWRVAPPSRHEHPARPLMPRALSATPYVRGDSA